MPGGGCVDRAAGGSEPVLPALDGFSLLGTSSGTQISIINGDMSVLMAYTYFTSPSFILVLVKPRSDLWKSWYTLKGEILFIFIASMIAIFGRLAAYII